MGRPPLSYFAPSYFAPSYFAPSDFASTAAGAPLSDVAALAWVRDRLEDSGLFGSVRIGRGRGPASGEFPLAWVLPVAFTEADDHDPIALTRTLRFAVWVAVASEGTDDRAALDQLRRLDLLSNAVADRIADGPPWSIPGLSRVESGRYEAPIEATNPDLAALTLFGSIAYLIEGRAGRRESQAEEPWD
jgi:hypothetical protein